MKTAPVSGSWALVTERNIDDYFGENYDFSGLFCDNNDYNATMYNQNEQSDFESTIHNDH